jgi:predicted dehydrogenase
METPRLAMIGCGAIAEFHAPAFQAAGFELAAVCSRPGSPRVRPFAERFHIPRVFDQVNELLNAREEWDALLIAVTVDPTLELLERALETQAPILVEKPIACRTADLARLVNRDLPVIVAYNRRFYRPVREAQKEVRNNPPLLAHLALPDFVKTPNRPADDPGYLRDFFWNSVHGLDLARFVFGDLKVEHVQRLTNAHGALAGIGATLSTDTGSVVQFTANWQTPANFALVLDQPGRRFELRPFEAAAVYEGMEIVEASDEVPVRRYLPKKVHSINLDEWDTRFKPGFYAQAQALAALLRGDDPYPAARLEDAYAVVELAEQLAGQTYVSEG